MYVHRFFRHANRELIPMVFLLFVTVTQKLVPLAPSHDLMMRSQGYSIQTKYLFRNNFHIVGIWIVTKRRKKNPLNNKIS